MDDFFGESETFSGLIDIIATHITQAVDAIIGLADVAYVEMSVGVGLTHSRKRNSGERRVVQILLNTDDNTGHRVQVFRIDHIAVHLKRIDYATRRERECISFQDILLVEVTDSIAEIDGIGRAVLQRFLEDQRDLLSHRFDLGRMLLRRRYEHMFAHIVQLEVLIKDYLHTFAMIVECAVLRRLFQDFRRRLIFRTTLRPDTTVCTPCQKQKAHQ